MAMKNILVFMLVIFSSNIFAQKKQNILFIAVDDLKPMLNCYGVEDIHSPNIDKLADAGTVFINSQCQQAVCSPSRASLMFGLRPDKTRIWDLQTPVRTATKKNKTVAQHFKENGYETVAFGKIFHISMADDGHDTQSWSIPYKEVNQYNYPKELGEPFGTHFQDPELKAELQSSYDALIKKGIKPGQARNQTLQNLKKSTECISVVDEAYQDGQSAINAVNMIKKLSNKEKPFFIAVGFKKPHLPFVAPKKYWDLYDRNNIELAKWQKAPVGAPEFAMHTWGELKSYSDIDPEIMPSGILNDEKQRELIHGYMASVSYTDAQIGKLIDELKKQGVDGNTVIVLWGDHGWHLGDHNLWCKHSNFEQATRSPLIFVAPQEKAGQKNSSPVEFVDIYPTLCDLAGVNITEDLDGVSLKPILDGSREKVKEFAISQYPRGANMGYSLRSDRYRYTAWFKYDYRGKEKPTKQNLIAEELYDYGTDPDETKNHAEEAEYSGVRKELSEQLLNFLK
jgi:arylsulfatase A-like enzyme